MAGQTKALEQTYEPHLASERKKKNEVRNMKFQTKHGMSKTRFNMIWRGMKRRCNNPDYKNYGGRGISYSQDWESFEGFFRDMYDSYNQHVNDFGESNTTLDRIDVNGDYTKENCKWNTWKNQHRNRTNNKRYLVDGLNLTIAEHAEMRGLKQATIYTRIYQGMNIHDALNKPIKSRQKKNG